MKKLNNKGFTLVELIVVIAILGVLMAVLVPQYIQYVEKSRIGTDESYIGEVAHTVELAVAGEETLYGAEFTISFDTNGKFATAIVTGKATTDQKSTLDTALTQVFPDNTNVSATNKVFKSKLYTAEYADSTITLGANGKTSWAKAVK